MKAHSCRSCNLGFTPTPRQIRKCDWICPACKRATRNSTKEASRHKKYRLNSSDKIASYERDRIHEKKEYRAGNGFRWHAYRLREMNENPERSLFECGCILLEDALGIASPEMNPAEILMIKETIVTT